MSNNGTTVVRRRLMLVTTTTGYQTQSFVEAGLRLGVDVVIASDRCHMLDDPWRDHALPIRFEQPEAAAVTIQRFASNQPVEALLALGDRATVVAAIAAHKLGLPSNPVDAVERARNKYRSRQALRDAGLPVPDFKRFSVDCDPHSVVAQVPCPCVLKPLILSASRGVIRADSAEQFVRAFERIARLLSRPDVARMRDPEASFIQVESFIPGREYALEGLLHDGVLEVLALFDKPDPLDGPFFEETIYTTPSRLPVDEQDRIARVMTRAAHALGLRDGPIHGEARVNREGIFVLEIAARPIGGLCARALRFTRSGGTEAISLEELLLRNALREDIREWRREQAAAGVMMIPIQRHGILSEVEGAEEATQVTHIEAIEITAKLDQELEPLPESATYLGFIFARATHPAQVEHALREAHNRLRFHFAEKLPLVGSR